MLWNKHCSLNQMMYPSPSTAQSLPWPSSPDPVFHTFLISIYFLCTTSKLIRAISTPPRALLSAYQTPQHPAKLKHPSPPNHKLQFILLWSYICCYYPKTQRVLLFILSGKALSGPPAAAVGNKKEHQVPLLACSLMGRRLGVNLFPVWGEDRGVSQGLVGAGA